MSVIAAKMNNYEDVLKLKLYFFGQRYLDLYSFVKGVIDEFSFSNPKAANRLIELLKNEDIIFKGAAESIMYDPEFVKAVCWKFYENNVEEHQPED